MSTKYCSACKETKSTGDFSKRTRNKDGLCYICKNCINERTRKIRLEDLDRIRERDRKYYADNREKELRRRKIWRKNNPDKITEQNKKQYKKYPERFVERNRKYYEANSEQEKERKRQWRKDNPDKAELKNEALRLQRLERKMELVIAFGDCCHDCKISFPFPYYEYEFHHVAKKDINIGSVILHEWPRLAKEVSKCLLLCANCHKVRHGRETYE